MKSISTGCMAQIQSTVCKQGIIHEHAKLVTETEFELSSMGGGPKMEQALKSNRL